MRNKRDELQEAIREVRRSWAYLEGVNADEFRRMVGAVLRERFGWPDGEIEKATGAPEFPEA
jgi:hypothetical protein